MLSFLIESIRSRKALFISATFMVMIMKACTVIPAFILGKIIDDLSGKIPIAHPQVTPLVIAFTLLIILQAIINPLQTYQLVKLVQHTIKDKSIFWTAKILTREFEEFSSLRLGGVTRSLERGITAHEKLLTFFVTTALPLAVEVMLVSAILIYVAGGQLFLAILAASASYLITCHQLISWRRSHLADVNTQEDTVSTKLINTLQAGKQIKLEHANETAMRSLCESFSGYATAAITVAASGAALSSARILFMGLCTAGVLGWGIHDQMSGSPRLTVGELVAIFSVAGGLLMSISGLAEAYRTLDQFLVDKQRLTDVLALPGIEGTEPPNSSGPISQLSIRGQPGLANGYLHFYTTQSVAIIGGSGAGKTTFLEVVAGAIRNRRNDIYVNGVHLESSGTAEYLYHVRYCPQLPVFLEGQFQHAVLYGQEQSPDLQRSIRALDLSEIAEHRIITEGAKNISGGEAKRLSLLRLINRPGYFNLFDEPTSSLDRQTATLVWETLFRAFHGKGLICVTHDLDALPLFDRVVVVKEGVVIADGPWSTLKHETKLQETFEQINA